METQANNDFAQMYDILWRIGKRIDSLERDSSFIEHSITDIENKRAECYSDLAAEYMRIESLTECIRKDLKGCVMTIIRLSAFMKDAVKKDQLGQLSSTIDKINFEEFVTQTDIKRGMADGK